LLCAFRSQRIDLALQRRLQIRVVHQRRRAHARGDDVRPRFCASDHDTNIIVSLTRVSFFVRSSFVKAKIIFVNDPSDSDRSKHRFTPVSRARERKRKGNAREKAGSLRNALAKAAHATPVAAPKTAWNVVATIRAKE